MKMRNRVLASVGFLLVTTTVLAQAVKVFEGNVVSPDGSASAPSISHKGDSNNGFYYPGADITAITTAGTERVRVDASGRMLINGQTQYGRATQLLEVNSSGSGGASFSNWSNNGSNETIFDFNRSKSGSIGTQTAVASGDNIAFIIARGSDGNAFQDAASIQFIIDGSVSTSPAGDMPGRISLLTAPDNGTGMIERVRIDNTGAMSIGNGGSGGTPYLYSTTTTGTTTCDTACQTEPATLNSASGRCISAWRTDTGAPLTGGALGFGCGDSTSVNKSCLCSAIK